MREVIATGKTEEEATEKACVELGMSRDEVSVEILEMPVNKLFKKIPAKVRVSVDGAEAAPAPPSVKPAGGAPLPKATAPAAMKAAGEKTAPILPEEPEVALVLEEHPQARLAAGYLQSIFDAMGAGPVQMTAYAQGDATLFRIEGEAIASKIEIRGEVIQALSYLVDRAVNAGVDKKDAGYLRVRLDVAGYRNRREGELIALANRTGKEVARTARSRTLAPMNPYERLIVHTAISKIDGVISESVGADTERRVVIKSLAPNATDGGDWKPPRAGGRPRPGGARRSGAGGGWRRGGSDRYDRSSSGHSGDRERGGGRYEKRTGTPEREYAEHPRDPEAAPVVPNQREAIRDGEDLPLYGKIEL
jgi:spoIIIJ-associated protein